MSYHNSQVFRPTFQGCYLRKANECPSEPKLSYIYSDMKIHFIQCFGHISIPEFILLWRSGNDVAEHDSDVC